MAGQSKLIKKDYLWVLREIVREFPGSPSGVVACLMSSFSFLSPFFLYLSFPGLTYKSPLDSSSSIYQSRSSIIKQRLTSSFSRELLENMETLCSIGYFFMIFPSSSPQDL